MRQIVWRNSDDHIANQDRMATESRDRYSMRVCPIGRIKSASATPDLAVDVVYGKNVDGFSIDPENCQIREFLD